MPEPYGDNNPVGYVTSFFVMPSQRNKGAGSGLLEALKQHSRSAGLEGLIIWPSERSPTSLSALRFPASRGTGGTSARHLMRSTSDISRRLSASPTASAWSCPTRAGSRSRGDLEGAARAGTAVQAAGGLGRGRNRRA
ncbi:GNAT family N-acetyltransferase [Streptomyces sp. ISL-11]|uniref:GNAT family N-acetyltransferase n=1 Tax=Streptomyces sp. ISL-11 TaxID=2819174 RepID=UPI0035B03B1E